MSSIVRLGNKRLETQPDYELTYQHFGLIEGQVAFKAAEVPVAEFAKLLGTGHPDDNRVELYAFRIQRGVAGIRLAVFDCVGLTRDPTDRTVSYPAANNSEPIETHPKFTTFAGSPGSPLNGAIFDEDDNTFLGFGDGAPADLRGVRSYYRSHLICRATYYSRKPPQFSEMGKIVAKPPKVPDIPGVKEWLQLAPSSEQVGRVFRITEELIGGGANAISKTIYG